MKSPGDVDPTDPLVQTRAALLDAIDALGAHRDAVIVIGAQAVHLRTGGVDVAIAETTKDADVALDPRSLADDPLVEAAMTSAGFLPAVPPQPGSWATPAGIPVDLMVPEALAGAGGRSARGARIPPHSRKATRRARGLEAVLVDNDEIEIRALDPRDARSVRVRVAGPAALLVAKVHKIWERRDSPSRLNDKDAHDAYRLLRKYETVGLAEILERLLDDQLSRDVTAEAIDHLAELFGSSDALGAVMAGRAEEGLGDPEQVAVAISILAGDLVADVGSR